MLLRFGILRELTAPLTPDRRGPDFIDPIAMRHSDCGTLREKGVG